MGMLSFEVPHALSKDDAKKRTEALVQYWSKKYGVIAQWTGDSAKLAGAVMGMKMDATLTIQDSKIGGEASDPGLLLRSSAKKYLTRKFAYALDPKTDLASITRGED